MKQTFGSTRFACIGLLLAAVSASGSAVARGAVSASVLEEQAKAGIKTLMVPSPYRISEPALAGKIRYRLAFVDGAALSLPETGEQHVDRQSDGFIVTICRAHCGHEATPGAAELQRYLQPNHWVQSSDKVIKDFARISPLIEPVDKRMPKLVDAVGARMTGAIEFRHYWTAREAYDSQSGDCTEMAVLLAAAARARGIPTRVVAGLAYASRFLGGQHVFGPHMWVQAWNGERWVSYDAGLGDFDAGRIALVIGDGTPASLAVANAMIHKLRIDGAEGLVSMAAGAGR